jgi:PqqD family protein of HPr-rel-A system
VVFDEGSGDTHLLDALSAEVLRALEEFPADVPSLIARVAAGLGPGPLPDIEGHVRAAIERFREIGLVEEAAA